MQNECMILKGAAQRNPKTCSKVYIMQTQQCTSLVLLPRLVGTLEWRYGLALVLVERLMDDTTVLDVNVRRVSIMLPCQSMLHPVVVITLPGPIQYASTKLQALEMRTSVKSSRACAPRDSLRAAAAVMVWTAHWRRLRSSKVSTRSLKGTYTE
jgi:hypothetical protein